MIAEVISIGTELLMGQVLNTNAQFLSGRLCALGVTQHRQSVIGDNPQRLREAYETALSRADVVITSGGLGPTGDDITKAVLADLLGETLICHEQAAQIIRDYFENRLNRPMSENNLSQALFTRDSIILPNLNGTAPGAIVPCDALFAGKVVIHLPGPPIELEPMFDLSVAPYLERRSGHRLVSRYIRIFGMGESEVDFLLHDLMQGANPSLSPYCSTGEVQLRATVLCQEGQDCESLFGPLIEEVKRRLPDVIYSVSDTDLGSLQDTVVSLLSHKGLTVGVCESLTGGMLGSLIAQIPGAAQVFCGGLITYTETQKMNLAGVSAQTLKDYTAVSKETAAEMALGARQKTGADIGVSLTGYAGPEAPEGFPVGLVYIGISTEKGIRTYECRLSGLRQRIRVLACLHALNHVRLEAKAYYAEKATEIHCDE